MSAGTRGETRNKAWAESDGLGKRLLRSMGWKEGEGLGKNGQGTVANVKLERAVGDAGLGFGKDGSATAATAGDAASNGLSASVPLRRAGAHESARWN